MEIDFELIEKIVKVIRNAYDEAKQIKNKNIKNKELNDIVTDIDIFMEDKIVTFIREHFPNHSIYSNGNIHNEIVSVIDDKI